MRGKESIVQSERKEKRSFLCELEGVIKEKRENERKKRERERGGGWAREVFVQKMTGFVGSRLFDKDMELMMMEGLKSKNLQDEDEDESDGGEAGGEEEEDEERAGGADEDEEEDDEEDDEEDSPRGETIERDRSMMRRKQRAQPSAERSVEATILMSSSSP